MCVRARCVVQNTNSRRIEYAKYVAAADAAEYDVLVLEVHCPDKAHALQFAARNRHRVPPAEVLKLLARWETDDDALLLKPCMEVVRSEEDELGAGAGAGSGGSGGSSGSVSVTGSFLKWLTDHHMFHTDKKRPHTHLCCLPGLGAPVRFVNVPRGHRAAFLDAYVAHAADPLYLLELPTLPRFPMYFDVDVMADAAMSQDLLADVVRTMLRKCAAFATDGKPLTAFVTGCVSTIGARVRSGFHVHMPGCVVTVDQAQEARDAVVASLTEEHPGGLNWDAVVDDAVYLGGCGLRMVGSRKVTRGVDTGRVHALVMVVDGDGEATLPPMSLREVLDVTSLRVAEE